MSFRKSNEQTLGEAIRELIETYKLGNKLNEARMIASWDRIVGPMIAKHTVSISVKHRKLFVELDSAAVRNELIFYRNKVKNLMNKAAGDNLIDEIILR